MSLSVIVILGCRHSRFIFHLSSQDSGLCQNGGTCSPDCDVEPYFYRCDCTAEWTGHNCTSKASVVILL